MKKIIFILSVIACSLSVSSQTLNPFPSTDSLRKFINKWIRNSAVDAFTNLRLNTSLIGMSRFLDSAYGGQVKSFGALNDSTIRLITIENDTFNVTIGGATQLTDSSFTVAGDTIVIRGTGTFENFVNADLTLSDPIRIHNFGINQMRFNFTGLGDNGDGYVALNEDNIPGIVIQGDGSFIPPLIVFKDLSYPSATATLGAYQSEFQMNTAKDGNSGHLYTSPTLFSLGYINGARSKSISGHFAGSTLPNQGISVVDNIDSAGMHYILSYKINGLSKFGNRWIPDWGAVQDAVADGSVTLNQYSLAVGNENNSVASSDARYIDSTKEIQVSNASVGKHFQTGNTPFRFGEIGDTCVFFGNSITAGTSLGSAINLRQSSRISSALKSQELNYAISGTRIVSLATGDSAMFERIFRIPVYRPTLKYLFFEYSTNDWHTTAVDTGVYRTQYSQVLDSALINRGWPADSIVVVSHGFSLDDDPLVIPRDTTILRITQEVAESKNVKFVNVREAMVRAGGIDLLKTDSIHPNTYGHEIWANTVLDSLKVQYGNIRAKGVLQAGNLVAKAIRYDIPAITLLDSSDNAFLQIRGRWLSSNSSWFGIGNKALENNTLSGIGNTAIGDSALATNTTGLNNTAIGNQALARNISGYNLVAIGKSAMQFNATGQNQMALGMRALMNNTTGSNNVAIGYEALHTQTTVSNNFGIGYAALKNNTGANNGAIGTNSLVTNTTGTNNLSIGNSALTTNSTGHRNTGIGMRALAFNTASDNTAIGYQAGDTTGTGSFNTYIGSQAGMRNSSGINNTFIGRSAGSIITSGNYNTIIGTYNGISSSASNNVVVADGNGSIVLHRISTGEVGVATSEPTERLDINGRLRIRSINNNNSPDTVATISEGKIERTSIAALKAILGVESGSYTPTLTNTTNISSSTLQRATYSKNGNIVTGAFAVEMATGSGNCVLDIELPVPSTFVTIYDVVGTASSADVLNGRSGVVNANVGASGMKLIFGGNGATMTFWINYQYEITPP